MTRQGFYVSLAGIPDTIFQVYKGKADKWHELDGLKLFSHAASAIRDGYTDNEWQRRDMLLLMAMLNDVLAAEPPQFEAAPAAAPHRPVRRRHRKLGSNVVDLTATRRERDDLAGRSS